MSFGEELKREIEQDRLRREGEQALIDRTVARLPELRRLWEQQARDFAAAAASIGLVPMDGRYGQFGHPWPGAFVLSDGRLRDNTGHGYGRRDAPILTGELNPSVEDVRLSRNRYESVQERVVLFGRDLLGCTLADELIIGSGSEEALGWISYDTFESRLRWEIRACLEGRG